MDSAHDINKTFRQFELLDALWTLDRISLHWEVEVEPDVARLFAHKCQSYNEATSANLIDLLESVEMAIPRSQFGPDNPNTGQPGYKVVVGNSCSRLVVISIRKLLLPEDTDYEKIKALMSVASNRYECNEHSIVREDQHVIEFRFWWD